MIKQNKTIFTASHGTTECECKQASKVNTVADLTKKKKKKKKKKSNSEKADESKSVFRDNSLAIDFAVICSM